MITILPYLAIFPLLLLTCMFYSSVISISLISIGQLYLDCPYIQINFVIYCLLITLFSLLTLLLISKEISLIWCWQIQKTLLVVLKSAVIYLLILHQIIFSFPFLFSLLIAQITSATIIKCYKFLQA